ncbi:MAG: hypothetical protein IJO09_09340 [Oscillospiraceae bacterium]|nr:hypothetical protein [Oscillospiraceae bacterium]
MKVCELLKVYDFHDSLMEEIVLNEKRICMRIDFCNWKQDGYREGEETKEILLVFEDVDYTEIPPVESNSDEIIDVKRKGTTGVEFLLFNDVKNITYSVVVFAKSVSIR